MAKTETQINLKINKGNYAKIQENLDSIGENELILTDDKNIPVPTTNDNGKILYVANGEYELGDALSIEVVVQQLNEGTTTISLTQAQENTLLDHTKSPMQIIVRVDTQRYVFYKQIETETVERYTCITPTTSALYSYMLQYTKNSGELVLYDSVDIQLKNLITDIETHKTENGSYPSTKAVYNFVKGETKYIIVEDESSLPTTNVTTGTLAYCQSQNTEGSQFWIYRQSEWQQILIENGKWNIIINEHFSIKEYTLSNSDITTLIQNIAKISEGSVVIPYINIGFSDGTQLVFSTNVFAKRTNSDELVNATQLLIYNGKQYISILKVVPEDDPNNPDDIILNFTLSFQEIEGGGSSTGGGSGKLYEWKATISFYDTNGKKNTFAGTDIDFSFLMYESNWERFKVLAQAKGITLNQPSDLTTLINTTLNETTSSQTADVLSMFMFLCTEVDKVLLKEDLGNDDYLELEMFTLWTLAPFLQCANDDLSIVLLDVNDAPLGINCDNSCTLTEYGTSGGGGAIATKKWYKFSLKTNVSDGQGGTRNDAENELISYIDEEQLQELITNVNTAMGTSYSTKEDLIALYDTLKSDDLSNSLQTYLLLCGLFTWLCNYSQYTNAKPTYRLQMDNGEEQRMNVVITIFDGGAGSIFVATGYNSIDIPFVDNFNDTVMTGDVSKMAFDSNSTLTIIEETETTGGSSSSQPTIPERFSLAYNLVVNINQEQFANGSWTGSNNDNIRTFQYNGSNADQAKATELVEFLTGVPILDEYNATKPTPCFVFCTQSNICWKLQWDNSLLHAYKVENFPFEVKQKYYNFVLSDNNVVLQLNIPYATMQDVYDSINQVLGGNISTPQEVIAVYDSLKADNIQSQQYGMLIQLFNGLAQSCLYYNLCNIIGDMDGVYKVAGTSAFTGILYNGNNELFSMTSATGKISFTSSSTLLIYERDEDELD